MPLIVDNSLLSLHFCRSTGNDYLACEMPDRALSVCRVHASALHLTARSTLPALPASPRFVRVSLAAGQLEVLLVAQWHTNALMKSAVEQVRMHSVL